MQKDVVERAQEIYASTGRPCASSEALNLLPELIETISTLRSPEEAIAAAFGRQIKERNKMFWAEEAVLAARIALKKKEGELMLSGAIIGKNAETRDAQLANGTSAERAALERAEAEKRAAQLAYDCASLVVDSLKWRIRAVEAGL